MDQILSVIITILPIALLALSVWLMFLAYNDLLKRNVPARMWWAFIILMFPIAGPLFYFMNFRDRL